MSLKAVFKEEAPVKADLGEIVTGLAATVSVGTVTDGETASVVNSGTAQNAKLDFVLPRGAKGDPGGVVSFNNRTGIVMPEKGDYTADQVGAAPSGFGWGEKVVEVRATSAQESHEDYCTKLDAILSNMPNNTAALILAYPPEIYGRAATTISILYKGSDEYATLFNCGAAEPSFNGWRIYKEKGAWYPFEWVNPPMTLGVEYRTTERWNGKLVYAKYVNFGSAPNATTKSVSHGIENFAQCAGWTGILGGANLQGHSGITAVDINATSIAITTDKDLSASAVYVAIKYTKSTD